MSPDAERGSEDAPAGRAALTMAPVTVLVVDDQPAVREGLSRLIACSPLALRGIATAASGGEALQLAAQLKPELVVLDADLAGEDGLLLIPLLAPARVLVLTCHGDRETRERAARNGCDAFIEKHQSAADLLAALTGLVTLQLRGEETPTSDNRNAHHKSVDSSFAPVAPPP